jgi:hypothetical protein
VGRAFAKGAFTPLIYLEIFQSVLFAKQRILMAKQTQRILNI